MHMRQGFGVALLILGLLAAGAEARQITDLAGRQVGVPDKVRKVYCMSPTCQILMYTLAPDLLAGWNYQPTPGEKAMLVAPYRDLPVLGGWFGRNNTGNIEEIMKVHPDVMISIGDPMAVSVAERVEKQTGLPVLIGDWNLEKLAGNYRMLGELTGRQARAKLLADYCAGTLARIKAKVGAIPEAQRRRVYYAEGPKGLATDPGGSAHSESIVYAGGHNVAEVQGDHGYGEIPVSMEQLLVWNPEIVIAGYDHEMSPGAFYRGVWNDPLWRQVKAVKERAVYEAPQFPFNWIDRPPSANRVIGILWLANVFYPDRFHDNMKNETRKFYKLFYHRDLSQAELSQLLAQTVKHGDKLP
jgi:iron complex transport system substrate-binding protein